VELETGVELKNVGFRFRRAIENQNGGYDSIVDPNQNSSTISALGNSRESTCYSFIDTDSLGDGTYYYLLEDISDNGKVTFHCGQVDAVTIGQGPAIDLELAINYCKEVTGSNN
jgi:hypothetical protein